MAGLAGDLLSSIKVKAQLLLVGTGALIAFYAVLVVQPIKVAQRRFVAGKSQLLVEIVIFQRAAAERGDLPVAQQVLVERKSERVLGFVKAGNHQKQLLDQGRNPDAAGL